MKFTFRSAKFGHSEHYGAMAGISWGFPPKSVRSWPVVQTTFQRAELFIKGWIYTQMTMSQVANARFTPPLWVNQLQIKKSRIKSFQMPLETCIAQQFLRNKNCVNFALYVFCSSAASSCKSCTPTSNIRNANAILTELSLCSNFTNASITIGTFLQQCGYIK